MKPQPPFSISSPSRDRKPSARRSRMENVCFDPVTGAPRMYDWQLTSTGPAAWDLCYFFAQSLGETEWPDLGERCIAAYFKKLTEEGVANYSEADLRRDLQIAAACCSALPAWLELFVSPWRGGEEYCGGHHPKILGGDAAPEIHRSAGTALSTLLSE